MVYINGNREHCALYWHGSVKIDNLEHLVKSLEDADVFSDLTISQCIKKIKAQLSIVKDWQAAGVEPGKFDAISANIIICARVMAEEYRRSY